MINLIFVDVDKQENTYDCGLYVIAYATSVYHGDDVSQIKYHSQEMRQHLLRCLKEVLYPSPLRASGPPLGE